MAKLCTIQYGEHTLGPGCQAVLHLTMVCFSIRSWATKICEAHNRHYTTHRKTMIDKTSSRHRKSSSGRRPPRLDARARGARPLPRGTPNPQQPPRRASRNSPRPRAAAYRRAPRAAECVPRSDSEKRKSRDSKKYVVQDAFGESTRFYTRLRVYGYERVSRLDTSSTARNVCLSTSPRARAFP